MTVKFHPAARAEILEARLWYDERSPLAAVAFAQELATAVSRISSAPMRFPAAEHGARRLVLRRFPYNVYYRIVADETIVVVALAHQKRRPYYWSGR
jgi:plasmid stabilization system protein ParE